MARLTFTRHTIEDNEVRPSIIRNQVPWPRVDRERTIRDAGFDPNAELEFGLLEGFLDSV